MIRYKYKPILVMLDHMHGELAEVKELHFVISERDGEGKIWTHIETFPERGMTNKFSPSVFQIHETTSFDNLIDACLNRVPTLTAMVKKLMGRKELEEELDHYFEHIQTSISK